MSFVCDCDGTMDCRYCNIEIVVLTYYHMNAITFLSKATQDGIYSSGIACLAHPYVRVGL